MKGHRRRRALITLGLLVAFALRVYRLGHQNVWWDEGLSVLAARMSFTEATLWTAADVHPPLYFWSLWLWTRLAGQTEYALRFITVIPSFLTVAALVPLARRLARKGVAVLALWLLALSRFHIWWSQEMRMYVLAGFCSLLSLYFLALLVKRRPSRWAWLGWALTTLGALYTIYSSVMLVFVQNLFMLVAGLRRRRPWAFWGRWIVAQLPVGLLVAGWLALALPRMRSWSVVEQPASLAFVTELYAVLLTLGISTDVGSYLLPAALTFALTVAGVALILRGKGWDDAPLPTPLGLFLLVVTVVTPPVVIWLLTQPRSFFYTPRVEARYLLPFAPAFYLLLAWALWGWLRRRRLRVAGAVATVALLATFVATLPGYYTGRYPKDDYRSLARVLWAYARPSDAVLLVSEGRYPLFFTYYDAPAAPEDRPPVVRFLRGQRELAPEMVDEALQAMAEEHDRIWLAQVEAGLQDPQGYVEGWLAERYARPFSLAVEHNAVSLFTAEDEVPTVPAGRTPAQHEVTRSVAPGVQLLGYDLLTPEVRPLDTVRVGLYLEVSRPITLTATLVGPQGPAAEVALRLGPVDGVVRRQVAFPITPYTPAGRYHLELSAGEDEALTLGEALVTRTRRPPEVASVPHRLDAGLRWEDEVVRLLGYALPGAERGDVPTVKAGEEIVLRLYWQSDAPLEGNYQVFTHLVGTAHNPATGGPLWAQDDQTPLEGAYPTYHWLPGTPLEDVYHLTVPHDAPPGEYRLNVGMYRPEDGERLLVAGEGANSETRAITLTPVVVLK